MGKSKEPKDKSRGTIDKYMSLRSSGTMSETQAVDLDTEAENASHNRSVQPVQGSESTGVCAQPEQIGQGQSAAADPAQAGDPTQPELSEHQSEQTNNMAPEVNGHNAVSKQPTLNTDGAEAPRQHMCNSDVVGLLKRMEQKIDTIDQTTKDMRASFDRRLGVLEGQVTSNTKKVGDLEDSVNYAHKGIEEHKDIVARLKRDNTELREKLNSTQKCSKTLSTQLEDFKQDMMQQMNDIERRSRAYSIRVKGVTAETVSASSGDHKKVVAEILVKNKLVTATNVSDVVDRLEIAHPLGPPRIGKQNMIARFYARPYRDSVVRAAKGKYNLVGAEKIHEDLTKMDSDLKTKAYPKMKRAHDEGKRVKFQKGKLFINGEETPI